LHAALLKLQTFFDNKTLTNVFYTSLAKRNFMKRVFKRYERCSSCGCGCSWCCY